MILTNMTKNVYQERKLKTKKDKTIIKIKSHIMNEKGNEK